MIPQTQRNWRALSEVVKTGKQSCALRVLVLLKGPARYYFHIDNGTFTPDPDGVDLPELNAARMEAVRAAGEMINESKQSFWDHMTPWIMNVTDDQNRLLFILQFAAKVPSGEALYIPRETKNPPAEASG